jgi:hypothetical protein
MPESLGPVDRTLLAQALGIPESTATRRGMALLDAGSVARRTREQVRILKRGWVDLDDDGRPVRKEIA